MKSIVKSWTMRLALLVCTIAASNARAADADLRGEVGRFADSIKKLLDGRGEDSVAVGQFSGPANMATSAGSGIAHTLVEELVERGVMVKPRANLGIKGEYSLTEVPSEELNDRKRGINLLAVKVTAVVEGNFGRRVADIEFEATIKGETEVVSKLSPTISLTPGATRAERDRELRKQALESPQVFISGGVIRSNEKSPYGIEVLVDDAPVTASVEDGLAYISIAREQQYLVRLYNDSPYDAGVRLEIDGLSMFAFSDMRQSASTPDGKDNPRKGEPLYTTLIVPAKTKVDVRGWHRTNSESDSFKITEYAKSAAAVLGKEDNLGTITASFQAAWIEGETPPADEPGKLRSQGTGDATGFGPRVEEKYTEVSRRLGVLRDAVSVRYRR